MPAADWPAYGRDPGGSHYSPVNQINRDNVRDLKAAWTYRTGDLEPKGRTYAKAAFEATPIVVGGVMYVVTPHGKAIALDPATGAERWTFDARVDRNAGYSEVASRGVSFWRDNGAAAGAGCAERIFYGTIDARLIALDARTGRPCADFGKGGQLDLAVGVGARHEGDYQLTSPPAIVGDVVVTGSSVGDNTYRDMDRGTVRGFDARTGKTIWSWEPIDPALGSGAANAWSVISADTKTGLVFVPTGSASPDYFGGLRKGDNRWANSVVALEAATGRFVWGFQVVHHDLWDYDVASTPLLFDFRRDGKTIPAVAVTSKMGLLFALDRRTGKPLLPVEERPVPRSGVPGEESSPTQPFPATEALAPQRLTPAEAWGRTEEERKWCAERIASLRHEGIYTPPSLEGSLVTPGNMGGVPWGGPALEPERGWLIVNTNRLPAVVRLIPKDDFKTVRADAAKNRMTGEFSPQRGAAYGMYREFLRSPSGLPCSPPPWGALAAVDLSTGKKRWEVALGSMAPGEATGSINVGGPLVTGGKLVFIAATLEEKFRAFDVENGRELWSVELPAGGQATPMSYTINGKQYVVLAAGGHGKAGNKQGDYVMAWALP